MILILCSFNSVTIFWPNVNHTAGSTPGPKRSLINILHNKISVSGQHAAVHLQVSLLFLAIKQNFDEQDEALSYSMKGCSREHGSLTQVLLRPITTIHHYATE